MSLLINKYKGKENKDINFYLEQVLNSIKKKEEEKCEKRNINIC